MIRAFFEIWFILGLGIFFWMWFLGDPEKRVLKLWIKRAAISGLITLIFIGVLLLSNNISGV